MQREHSLIANSGIQIFTFSFSINLQEKAKLWFHEREDEDNKKWLLDLVYELREDDSVYYYSKKELHDEGFLSDSTFEFSASDLREEGITPLRIDDLNMDGVEGDIFPMSFQDRNCKLSAFENVWLPIPYFWKKTERRFDFAPMNWARMKLVPTFGPEGMKTYNVVLAFDTRAEYESGDEYKECPVFRDNFMDSMEFALCGDELQLMDYCTAGKNWSYVDEYLFHLVHPTLRGVDEIVGKERHMSYVATYAFLISYLASHELFPKIKLYKDQNVLSKNIDMVVDIGNSRTTALLIEDNCNFNQVRHLELVDYTNLFKETSDGVSVNKHARPFDMRLAFRKADFGDFGVRDSRQFVYPSLVRLGDEANELIRRATDIEGDAQSLSTYSSPKRYLWDSHENKEEWEFLVLKGEKRGKSTLNLQGITNQLKSDGTVDPEGNGGSSFRYSRRSLMTFSFLEMFAQAIVQINGEDHRVSMGKPSMPRKLKRVIVTCPTAMSKVEREALVGCAKDATVLLRNFLRCEDGTSGYDIEIIPASRSRKDSETSWYYDEATCSQLVYMYGEAGHKYKGCCNEFFKLYGKIEKGDARHSITVGSIDIGAGTSDLMVCKYSYEKGDVTTITPEPKFYDSFYFAGDDMLYALIKNVMILSERSAFRYEMRALPMPEYRQKMKNFFGEDYNGQTYADRMCRRDFNVQYSVPLMCHFLELLKNKSDDCTVGYDEVFASCPPSESVISGFRDRVGIDITTLRWQFCREEVSDIVRKEFEPLLKKIATVMYSFGCDVVLLSGRPASLPAIREIFLKYYPVAPNRLILLNNYYVGDWYPFGDNTGYITNGKTIVAMGGVIGHYASELSNLDKFVMNMDKLNEGLKSTINYIEASREDQPIDYLITPAKSQGDLTISRLPMTLVVRQIGMDTYPSRALYTIDFNAYKIADRLRKKAADDYVSDSKILSQVSDVKDALKKRMPFKITVERDPEDKENLSITSIVDKNGDEVIDSNLEVNIQSMGAAEEYWLDNGAFDF